MGNIVPGKDQHVSMLGLAFSDYVHTCLQASGLVASSVPSDVA